MMAEAVAQRLLSALRLELAGTLARLCAAVGAAESSILLPRGESHLVFFASSNSALTSAAAPAVPIGASFSGLAFRTGQTIAFADAAGQEAHNEAVDKHVGFQTHEFAAIPIHDQAVVGLLTLVNRPPGAAPRPFDVSELRRAEALALELARPLVLCANLLGEAAPAGADALDPVLVAALLELTEPERRIVHSLANALLQNRVE
jgi:hypothetical protein